MSLPSLALCVTVEEDSDRLKQLLEQMRGHVDKIVVAVQQDNSNALAIAKELADEVILVAQGEDALKPLLSAAGTDYVMQMHTDETLEHPERLREIIVKGYDVVCFPRRTWVSGYLSKCFERSDFFEGSDFQERMYWLGEPREGPKIVWNRAPESNYFAFECWIDRYSTIDEVREQIETCEKSALDESEPDDAINWLKSYKTAIEEEYARRKSQGDRIKILCEYAGKKSIGDILMTTPTVREIKRQYPEAEITYRTNLSDILGCGKKINKYRYECLHPAIDYLDIPRWKGGESEESYRSNFDLIVDWRSAYRGEKAILRNSYELMATWAGFEPSNGDYKPDWSYAKDEEEFGRNWIKQHCKTKRCVGLVLTTNNNSKIWPYSEDLINIILEKYSDVSVMLFGLLMPEQSCLTCLYRTFEVEPNTKREDYVWEAPKWYDPERLINCTVVDPCMAENLSPERKAMALNVRQQAAVYPQLNLLVTPDTGMMHIAAALNVPTVGIFSITSPELLIKHFPCVTAVASDYPCAPCYWKKKCPKPLDEHEPCKLAITVEKVMEEVDRRLKESRESGSND